MECLPEETVAHIQSTGCKAQKKSVIGAHNKCWKYLLCATTKHREAKHDFEFIGDDKDRQLEEPKIEDILPWEDVADDSVVVERANKVLFYFEFQRTSDQRRDYRERGESRVHAKHEAMSRIGEKFGVFSDGVYCSKLVWEILLKSKAVSSSETQRGFDDFISPSELYRRLLAIGAKEVDWFDIPRPQMIEFTHEYLVNGV
jgi:hypothetical protein